MRRISLTTSAINEITQRVSRFVRMQLIVNVTYGVFVALGLWLFGVPQALLWGVMGCLLRFIPYAGPWLAAILPTLLAIAIFPGWTRPLGVAGMFVVIEGVTNLILEPIFYCSGTGLSSLGVVCASIFWGWAWGPVGLLLAVPTTVCLTVIGKYLPQLSLLNQLFGTDVDVPKVGQVYQDLLVADAAALDRQLDEELESHTLAEICDQLLLPALAQLKKDLSFGAVDRTHARRVMRTLENVVLTAVPLASNGRELRLLCIAGQNEVDACAARLLGIAAQAQGVNAEALSANVLVSEVVNHVVQTQVEHVAIVQVIPASVPHSKRLIKALAPRISEKTELINLVVGDEAAAQQESQNFEPARREFTFVEIIAPLAEQETVAAAQSPAPVKKVAV
jgi:hypothetical protein